MGWGGDWANIIMMILALPMKAITQERARVRRPNLQPLTAAARSHQRSCGRRMCTAAPDYTFSTTLPSLRNTQLVSCQGVSILPSPIYVMAVLMMVKQPVPQRAVIETPLTLSPVQLFHGDDMLLISVIPAPGGFFVAT